MPNLPWWSGLVCCPWLIADARASARMVGVWWLVLSILTPFYHPYARLWLPVQAAGWVIVGGVIVELGPLERRQTFAALGGRPFRELAVLRLAIFLAFADRFCGATMARPLPDLLGPTDSIRTTLVVQNLIAEHQRRAPPRIATLRTLVRPSVAFYLDPRITIRPQRDLDQLLGEGQPGDWALVDEVLLLQEGDLRMALARLLTQWTQEAAWPVPLSPPTRLDIDPGAAYGTSTVWTPTLMLLRRTPREDGR
jgi:dolichyl-phosphate-mannose-protein mannosyltransferase